MSIFSFTLRRISRAQSRTLVAAAAYRSGSRLRDEQHGRWRDFSGKNDVAHSEILMPQGAAHLGGDRGHLWNAVDRRETRRNAHLAWDIIAALPPQLDLAANTLIARGFAEDVLTSKGYAADLNIHLPQKADGLLNPHAHIMAPARIIDPARGAPDLLGAFDSKPHLRISDLRAWRAGLAEHINAGLAAAGLDRRETHLSFRRQGLNLEPRFRLSISSWERAATSRPTSQGRKLKALSTRNGDRIIADPLTALRAVSREVTVFDEADLHMILRRHAEDAAHLELLKARVLGDPRTVALGRNARGSRLYVSQEEVDREADVIALGRALLGDGRLRIQEAGDPVGAAHAFLARAAPARGALFVPSPRIRQEIRRSCGPAGVLGLMDMPAILGSGDLGGAELLILEAHTLHAADLGVLLSAARAQALRVHVVGAPPVFGASLMTGSVFRGLLEEARGARPAEDPPLARFARLRALEMDGQGLDETINLRRRLESARALERRRAVLRAREADGGADDILGRRARLRTDDLGPEGMRPSRASPLEV